ncbi:MAG: DNA translocase FtsK [Gaiellales bacterium]|nr:MAG: DNA translocase FtsK [Gaiellales bacterium]
MAARTRKQAAARGGRAGKRQRRSARKRGNDLRHLRELGGLALIALGVFLAFVVYLGWSGGLVGSALETGLRFMFGILSFLAPPAFVALGAWLIFPEMPRGPVGLQVGVGLLAAALFLIAGANTFSILGSGAGHGGFFSIDNFPGRGGLVGETLYWLTASLVGDIGSTVAAVFLLLAAAFLITGASVRTVLLHSGLGARRAAARARRTTRQLGESLAEKRSRARGEAGSAAAPFGAGPEGAGETPGQALNAPLEAPFNGASDFPDIYGGREPALSLVVDEVDDEAQDQAPTEVIVAGGQVEPVQEELFPRDDEGEATEYVLPSPDLLYRSAEAAADDGSVNERVGRVLEETLASFGIEARVTGAVTGPRVTRYEIELAPGIKVSRVTSLKNDLAMALAATDIRILAPIPGKRAVGVEVPNPRSNLVTLGDIYRKAPGGLEPLTAWVGKDISGNPVFANLAKMPHLLVAGTTGSGKSSCINCMVSSILLSSTPDEVKMILIDPKTVELNHFEGIPHLLTPVVTNMKNAANVLANLVEEMESRYSRMQLVKAKHIDDLNHVRKMRGEKPLPYILLIVEEFADLMMVSPTDVEDAIIRLAQKSRAVGIHLVLAVQRPSVDVVTGRIKANVPSRIAFRVSSQVDSRVIIDAAGAESLLGSGDMLFRPVGSNHIQRVQGAYVSPEEIKLLTDHARSMKTPDFRYELLEGREIDEDEKLSSNDDELLPEAMQLVITHGTASVSFLQRRLRVGYSRAGRLIDMLEQKGVISGYEGSKPRRVLAGEEDLERLLDDFRGDDEGEPEPEPEPEEVAAFTEGD